MQKKFRNFAVGLLLFGVGAVTILSGRTNSFGDISSEKENLEDLVDQKSDAEEILAGLEDKKNDSQAYLNELDKQIGEFANKIYELEVQIGEKNTEITKIQEQIAQAEVDISEQYAAMKLRIQFMYENGNASYISMLFDSKSIGDFLNRAEYITELTGYDRQMLEQMQAKKNEIELAKKSLEQEVADLEVLQTVAKAEQAEAQKIVDAKTQEMNELNASIADAQEMVENLEYDIHSQEELIAEMESIEARRKAEEESRKKAEEESRKKAEEESRKKAEEASKKGEKVTTNKEEQTTASNNTNNGSQKFVWPVSGYSRISSYFGNRKDPFGAGTKMHKGIDIPAPLGTPIKAIGDGQVAWSYYHYSAGNWVGVDHGNGLYSVYMHMSKFLVKEGDIVKAGEVIGLMGSTGSSTGSHLHLGVRLNGSYVNPLNYVSP